MMILHIICNYFAVRAVCLRTLNEPRFLQVIDTYLKQEVIATPCEINRKEPIIFYHLGPNLLDLKLSGFQIRLGCSTKNCVAQFSKASYLVGVNNIYKNRMYVLIPSIDKRKMYVLVKDEATTDDVLCAYFHAVLLSIIVCALNDYPLSMYQDSTGDPRPFAQVCQTLQSAEWSRQPTENPDSLSGFQYEPTLELMGYVNKIVQDEWQRVLGGLLATGWDLKKHLLMVDEWRVCTAKAVTEAVPVGNMPMTSMLDLTRIIPFGDIITDFDLEEVANKEEYTIEPEVSIPKPAHGPKIYDQEMESANDKGPKKTTSTSDNSGENDHVKKD